MESYMVSVYIGHGGWVHYFLFFFQTILTTDSRSFCSCPQLVLGSWLSPMSELLWGASGRGWCEIMLFHFHFQIMAPAVLTETFSSSDVLL